MRRAEEFRRAANWLNGSTAAGLLLARCAGVRTHPYPGGLRVGGGYRWRLPVAGAFTVGNVVLFRRAVGPAEREPELARSALLAHEATHCTQYALLAGLPFLPAYFLACAWSWLRTGDVWSANLFERRAGLEAGGYRENPRRRRRRHQEQRSQEKPSRSA